MLFQPLPEHGVYTVFVELDNTKLELLHPLGEQSPIRNFLSKNKDGGIHHVCIEVDNIRAAMADLKAQGVRLLNAEPKIGAHGKPVVFLHPKVREESTWLCARTCLFISFIHDIIIVVLFFRIAEVS